MSGEASIVGSLAKHRRGRLLKDLLGVRTEAASPEGNGLCLAFAADFQDADGEGQDRWLQWTHLPGRTLLLLPPLKAGRFTRPIEWSVEPMIEVGGAPSGSLALALAPEVRHRLSGMLQIPKGGSWDDGAAHTMYYRKHPNAGLFAVTCLPLWSTALLGRGHLLEAWLTELHSLAGEPASTEVVTESKGFEPTPDHFAMLLHLCGGEFSSDAEALGALAASTIFSVPLDRAATCLRDLEANGLAAKGKLTEFGRKLLFASSYAVFAEALEENR
jgi:hypothetical protein